ncbi:lipopolysaccharide assembly protein LapA domain-containing protein [Flavobacteriaceae bacterium LMO-SS05]
MKFKTIVILSVFLLVVIVSIQNAQVTDINFLFWKLSASRVLIILGSFSVGILIGLLLAMKTRFFKKSKV